MSGPASSELGGLAIRLLRRGCANRKFYHIIVVPTYELCHRDGVEQIGTYDAMPNERNEKLLSLNVERFQYWVAQGARIKCRVGILLGLAGVLPMHPQALVFAAINRRDQKAEANEEAKKAESE